MSLLTRAVAVVAFIVALLAAPRVACAGELEDLLYARDAYNNSDYDVAILRLTSLLDRQPSVAPDVAETARKYLVAALLFTERRVDAVAMLERLLRDDPDAQFAPREFSGAVTSLVAATRERMSAELERVRVEHAAAERAQQEARARARQAALDRLSREVVSYQVPRVWMFVPFGVGQYVNGDNALGGVFTGVEVLALAGGIVSGTLAANLGLPYYSPEMNACTRTVCTALQVTQIASWSLLGAAIVFGAVQANVAYRPERASFRRRTPTPDELRRLQLSVAPSRDGVSIGLGGRF